jgi:hypothetical protein
MDITKCQETYITFAKKVFGIPKRGLGNGIFKATNVKVAIQEIVAEQDLGSKMMDPFDVNCKVSVSHAQPCRCVD